MIDILDSMTCTNTVIDTHDKGSQAIQCQDCIDHLNWIRLMVKPLDNMTIQQNQQAAMGRTLKFVGDMTLQELFIYQKMLEGMAAQCSLIYNQRLVKDKIADPLELKRQQEDWKAAERKQRLANAPTPVKKQLTARDKAIVSLMNVGLSRADAEKSVDSKFEEQGKATGNTFGTSTKV